MRKKWLLAIDLDKTLWDCSDISKLSLPFEKRSKYLFSDSQGSLVKVHSEIVELLGWARSNGAVVSVISWNEENKAVEALKVSNVIELIDFYVIENHPRKDLMALKLHRELSRKNLGEVTKCIVYIDDMEPFLRQVSQVFPNACTLRAWKDFTDAISLYKRVCECLTKCNMPCVEMSTRSLI